MYEEARQARETKILIILFCEEDKIVKEQETEMNIKLCRANTWYLRSLYRILEAKDKDSWITAQDEVDKQLRGLGFGENMIDKYGICAAKARQQSIHGPSGIINMPPYAPKKLGNGKTQMRKRVQSNRSSIWRGSIVERQRRVWNGRGAKIPAQSPQKSVLSGNGFLKSLRSTTSTK